MTVLMGACFLVLAAVNLFFWWDFFKNDELDPWYQIAIVFLSQLAWTIAGFYGAVYFGGKPEKYKRLGFFEVYDMQVSTEFLMSHFPYRGEEADERTFQEQLEDKGDWLLHGHVHCAWKQKKKMINVGVDQWAFAPVSQEEILELVKK